MEAARKLGVNQAFSQAAPQLGFAVPRHWPYCRETDGPLPCIFEAVCCCEDPLWADEGPSTYMPNT